MKGSLSLRTRGLLKLYKLFSSLHSACFLRRPKRRMDHQGSLDKKLSTLFVDLTLQQQSMSIITLYNIWFTDQEIPHQPIKARKTTRVMIIAFTAKDLEE